jgi:hypothetical protein
MLSFVLGLGLGLDLELEFGSILNIAIWINVDNQVTSELRIHGHYYVLLAYYIYLYTLALVKPGRIVSHMVLLFFPFLFFSGK